IDDRILFFPIFSRVVYLHQLIVKDSIKNRLIDFFLHRIHQVFVNKRTKCFAVVVRILVNRNPRFDFIQQLLLGFISQLRRICGIALLDYPRTASEASLTNIRYCTIGHTVRSDRGLHALVLFRNYLSNILNRYADVTVTVSGKDRVDSSAESQLRLAFRLSRFEYFAFYEASPDSLTNLRFTPKREGTTFCLQVADTTFQFFNLLLVLSELLSSCTL